MHKLQCCALGRSLAVVAAGALLLSGALVPTAGAAVRRAQHLGGVAGVISRSERASEPALQTPGAQPLAAPTAIPLLSPSPARLARAKARAARRVSSGPRRSADRASPASRAVLLDGLDSPGMSAEESAGFVTPPDTTGAIGPGNYVEFVNGTGISAYDRSLDSVSGPVELGEFIGFPSDFVFDPQIQWDESWGRWIYAMDDIEEESGEVTNYLAFGWSKTADPSNLTTEFSEEGLGAGWCEYFLETGSQFDDYPKLGHGNSGITIGTNVFDDESFEFLTSHIWSIAKPANPASCPVLTAGSIGVFGSEGEPLETEDGDRVSTPVPANTADSSPNSYVVAADYPEEGPQHQIMAWHVRGAGESAELVEDGNMEVGAYDFPANVPQPGTSEEIDSMDTRLTNAVAVTDPEVGEEAVWTQHTVDGPGGRSAVGWYELLPGTQTVRQEGTISDPAQFVFNAAISPAAEGDSAAIDFNLASASLTPTMHAESRDMQTPLGEMEGDVLLGTSAGHAVDSSCNTAAEEPCRWGDYAGASPDPLEPGVVWGSNQGLAAPSSNDARWTTRNFALRTDVRAPVAPTIAATDPASPANDNNPKVRGGAEARSTVRIYESADCSGPLAAQGSAAAFASPGLSAAVADNQTVQFTATATDAAGNTSPCSASIAYTESTPPPVPPPPPSSPRHGTAFGPKVAPVKGGKALLRLSCRGTGECRGALRLVVGVRVGKKKRVRNLTIAKATFSIAEGKATTIPVKLTGKGKALLQRADRHGLKVTLQGDGVHSRTMLLRSGGRRKRKHRRAKGA
jgi:hypothetical protein